MNRGSCQTLRQETADTGVSLYAPASRDARTTRFQAWPHSPVRTLPQKGMQITGKRGKRDASSACNQNIPALSAQSNSTGVELECCEHRQWPHFARQTPRGHHHTVQDRYAVFPRIPPGVLNILRAANFLIHLHHCQGVSVCSS